MPNETIETFMDKIDNSMHVGGEFLRKNSGLILLLAIVALAAYGFELFNFNLTIDEEVQGNLVIPNIEWLRQGRWAMYFLNGLVLPHPIVPFVALFMALVFHILAILLLLEAWGVHSTSERCLVGAVGVGFPIMAYMYAFATFNYGIGIGLFCTALSAFLVDRLPARRWWRAALPAAFAVGIYQGFVPGLVAVYLTQVLAAWSRGSRLTLSRIALAATLPVVAVVASMLVQETAVLVLDIEKSSYVGQYMTSGPFWEQLGTMTSAIATTMRAVYWGNSSIYAVDLGAMRVLVALSVIGILLKSSRLDASLVAKAVFMLSTLVLMVVPFLAGYALRGYLAMRFLVALPFSFMGFFALAVTSSLRAYRDVLLVVAAWSLFQFVVSTNALNGSSHLALQADRLLASRLIAAIDKAKDAHNPSAVKYLEVVGYYKRSATPLLPESETFGSSFFAWDEGNAGRVVLFLKTLGYGGLEAAPQERRVAHIALAAAMPAWPRAGSVRIVGDTVIVRFGPYSPTQKAALCTAGQIGVEAPSAAFCE